MKHSGFHRTIVAIAMMLIGWLPTLAHDTFLSTSKLFDQVQVWTSHGEINKAPVQEAATRAAAGEIYIGHCSINHQIWPYDGLSLSYDARVGVGAILTEGMLKQYVGATIVGMYVGWDDKYSTANYECFVRADKFNGETLTTGSDEVQFGWNYVSLEEVTLTEDMKTLAVGFYTDLLKDVCSIPKLYPYGKENSNFLWSGETNANGEVWYDYKELGSMPIVLVLEDKDGLFLILSTSIALNQTTATLKASETITLIATILPENATDKSVEWSSSDETVAVVDENGVVTAIALGETIITVTTVDGSNLSATCKVTVVPTLAESITLDKTEISLEATETATLVATVLPELTTNKSVTWTSSNEAVATVDANGKVTAVAVGEATITATTADGSNKSATCKVIVVPTLATSITLDYTEYEMAEKSDFQLTATILPELTTNKGVVWSSSDMWIASVDENGLVRAYSVGEAVITATTIDGSNLSASCKVTVVSSLAQSITLDKTEVSLKATETTTLVATVLPKLASNKSVEWSSSNEAIAVVDENGVVTAIAVGEATITATTTDGSNLSASCRVTVVPTLAETITLDKTEISLEATETATLIATVLPELATDKSVKWSSSNEAIAVVDENGVVTAVAVGEATITATTTDGSNLSASCKVVVKPTLATSITLDYTEYEMAEKSDFQLTATILPELTTNKGVVWSSSDMWIASVDENGLVRAYSVGEAVITATTIDGSNLSASCKVTVVSSLAQSITLDKTEVSLEVTETAALVATVLPEKASNKSVEWSSSNESVSVVDNNGVVTAISIGEAVITATTVDGSNLSASCKVTVIPTLAISIELDQTEARVEEKSEFQLTATILPKHTTNKEVAWSSSKKVIATVDETGLVFVKSVGEVVITATTTDGSNLSASCYINVYSSDIDGVEGDDLIVATIGDNIVVKNAKIDSIVRVYAADGSIISSEVATDGDVVVEAPIKGVYIVSVNGKTFKVIVK